MRLTDAQSQALKWLREHNDTGVFMKDGVLLAAGERAPVRRVTWNRLRDAGYLSIDGKRVTVNEGPQP